MKDVVDIIKNLQTLTVDDSAFRILKDFERVLDELDLYVYQNWEDGELIEGPIVSRYNVACKFMWPKKYMPDPDGGARLLDYGCKLSYEKTLISSPRKVYKPEDFRPGTKKGKIDLHPVWVVEITMPKKLMQDIYLGYQQSNSNRLADLMKYDSQPDNTQSVPSEPAPNAEV